MSRPWRRFRKPLRVNMGRVTKTRKDPPEARAITFKLGSRYSCCLTYQVSGAGTIACRRRNADRRPLDRQVGAHGGTHAYHANADGAGHAAHPRGHLAMHGASCVGENANLRMDAPRRRTTHQHAPRQRGERKRIRAHGTVANSDRRP